MTVLPCKVRFNFGVLLPVSLLGMEKNCYSMTLVSGVWVTITFYDGVNVIFLFIISCLFISVAKSLM